MPQAADEPDPLAAWGALEIRVGTVISVTPNRRSRAPAWVLEVDLGPHGIRTSSAQLTEGYGEDELLERQVVVVCNLPPLRIGGVKSEVLVLGAVGDGQTAQFPTVLLCPDKRVPDGSRIA